MEAPLFIDIDYFQKKKHGQNAYGDTVISQRYPQEGRLIAVLSDGLGSGIKANILSQMTATMISKFMAEGRDIIKASEVIMNSLPTCQVRKISYATFSIVDCCDNGNAYIVEEGNPQFVWIRGGQVLNPKSEVKTSKKFTNRHLQLYKIKLEPEDRLIFCSDGVTQSGLGSKEYKLGWRREGLIDLIKEKVKSNPTISSRQLSEDIVRIAEKKEPNKLAKDDISSAVLYFRKPRRLIVFTGPPYYSERDNEYARLFYSIEGKKVICGGTTANLVSRELNLPITSSMNSSKELPSCSTMKGVDLITEGILTLTKAVEYLENKDLSKENAAGYLVKMLLDSDCIDFIVGAKLNQAHYDPNLPVELEIRKNVIKRMIHVLENKYIKKTSLKFI